MNDERERKSQHELRDMPLSPLRAVAPDRHIRTGRIIVLSSKDISAMRPIRQGNPDSVNYTSAIPLPKASGTTLRRML